MPPLYAKPGHVTITGMVVVIQQPNYFAWLGYFEQILHADAWVVLENVQWIRQGRQHRARIALHPGQSRPLDRAFQWLTLPVYGHGHRACPLSALEIDRSSGWADQHRKTIHAVYGRAPHFRDQLAPLLERFFELTANERFFWKIAHESTLAVLRFLELGPQPKIASHLLSGIPATDATARLVTLCRSANAQIYSAALGSASYMDLSQFRDAGIRVVFQHYRHPTYTQSNPALAFRSHLSILDAIAHVPKREIRAWFRPPSWKSTLPQLDTAI